MDKREKQIRKNIAKRLHLSDKEGWEKLSEEERKTVIDEYLHLSSIENIGIAKALEENRNVSRGVGSLMIGSILGLSGGIAGNIVLNYIQLLPRWYQIYLEILLILSFLVLIWMFYHLIDRVSADGFKEDHILEHLQKRIKNKK